MVKRPQGSAALVSPCWRPGIWPLFEHQSCNFLCLPLFFVAFGRLGQMNKTKTIFKMIFLCLSFHALFLYHQMSTCPHALVPSQQHFSLLVCILATVLYWCTPFPFLLSFLPSLPFSSSPQCSLTPSALHSFVRLASSYPQHIRCPTNKSKGESMMPGPRNRV